MLDGGSLDDSSVFRWTFASGRWLGRRRVRHRQIAAALRISPSCVSKWTCRERETGSVAPAQVGGYKPRTLSGEVAEWLRWRVRAGPFTLRGLTAELAARGVKTQARAVWVFVHDEGLSFKNVWPAPSARGFIDGGV